jgi:kynurenine formamidase
MCPPEFFTSLQHRLGCLSPEGRRSAPIHGRPTYSLNYSRIVDLTHLLTPDFPTYNGTVDLAIETVKEFSRDRCNVKRWTVREHMGTHVDAPLHFSAGGASIDDVPIEDLVVPLVVIDISARAQDDSDTQVTPQDILAHEAKYGPLPDRACVAMHSGWDRFVRSQKFRNAEEDGTMHFPGFHIETAQMLLEHNIAGLGVDTLSIDHGRAKDFATHYCWLPAGRWAVECLANLGELPATGATIAVGAPKIAGATGGPSRIFVLA